MIRLCRYAPDGDRISAGEGDNVIAAGAGPDVVTTGAGRDLVCSDFCEFKTDGTVGVPRSLTSLATNIGGKWSCLWHARLPPFYPFSP